MGYFQVPVVCLIFETNFWISKRTSRVLCKCLKLHNEAIVLTIKVPQIETCWFPTQINFDSGKCDMAWIMTWIISILWFLVKVRAWNGYKSVFKTCIVSCFPMEWLLVFWATILFICLFNRSLHAETHLGPDGTIANLNHKCSSHAMKAYIRLLARWSTKIERERNRVEVRRWRKRRPQPLPTYQIEQLITVSPQDMRKKVLNLISIGKETHIQPYRLISSISLFFSCTTLLWCIRWKSLSFLSFT